MAKKAKRNGNGTKAKVAPQTEADSYRHPTAESPLRPDVGTQANFRKKKPPVIYRYDSSLSPALDWDGQNSARERGEALIREIIEAPTLEAAKSAAERLKALSKPFLNWSGKAERLSFDVPTLPLFVHERLSTEAIIETLTGHQKPMQQLGLFSDPQRSIADQMLKAYEYQDRWVNRMILGDSMVVMNSLLHYESLGGQVQMIYMDPPYGIRFGSNFQPFVRKRDVSHNDDDDMTREPEMVQAYRDTWELGLHSYLTYMRDRLTLARELLTPSGSVFVQISDENLHHVRELMDEVFGAENFCSVISFAKSTATTSEILPSPNDFILWYSRSRERLKYRPLFLWKKLGGDGGEYYTKVLLSDGTRRQLADDEIDKPTLLPAGSRIYRLDNLVSQGFRQYTTVPFEFAGKTYHPGSQMNWKATMEGMARLADAGRIEARANSLAYVRFFDDFPVYLLTSTWTDTSIAGRPGDKLYVVQTAEKAIQRCLLMTTDPGDLVLDPTCGSGTTAYVAEQWGRRWITADVSRVPLALARQRLLTATFPWYELKDDGRGPAGGFVYKRKQNSKGEEIGGIVPHVTLKSIANNQPPEEEVLVDRPEEVKSITRVTGPFAFEATLPTASDLSGEDTASRGADSDGDAQKFEDRMLEVLRKSPILHLDGNRTVKFRNIRQPARSMSLSAEALVDGTTDGKSLTPEEAVQISQEQSGQSLPLSAKPVAFLFGPENGAVNERGVYMAAMEARAKDYSHLYVIAFEIQANARNMVENCETVVGIPATFVKATLDLMMGDLLKNMRSSQVFSVCGMPDVEVRTRKDGQHEVELKGLDVFDPVTMKNQPRSGDDVPAWFLDTDYNGLCFHVCQAFFPRTSAWDNLKKALRATHAESVWDHLAGTVSAPFGAGEQKQIAVKVIDDRGNELMVVKGL